MRKKDATSSSADGLEVVDMESGEQVCSFESDRRLLRLTWRPDGRALAYFIQESGLRDRKLFIWDLDQDVHNQIAIPLSYSQPKVSWSPCGNYIAFTSNSAALVVVNTKNMEVNSYEGEVKDFDWNDESTSIALIVGVGSTQELRILDVDCRVKEKLPLTLGSVSELHWRGGSDLILLALSDNSVADRKNYEIYCLDLVSGKRKLLYGTTRKIESIERFSGANGMFFHLPEPGGIQDIFFLKNSHTEPVRLTRGGVNNIRSFDSKESVLYYKHYSQRENILASVCLDTPGKLNFVSGNSGPDLPGLIHETVDAELANGRTVPVLLSRVPGDRAKNAAFIRIHPLGHIQLDLDRWAETQLLVENGIHVIHVEARGKYTSDDIFAACLYAQNVLGVPRERVVLRGESKAAQLVIQAALRYPRGAGVLALVGFLGWPESYPSGNGVKPGEFRVLDFYGELDDKRPQGALGDLTRLFGYDALHSPNGISEMIAGEFHWLLYNRSHARLHTVLFETLKIEPDPSTFFD
ncbi:hypothetical protein MLD52_22070 [Puniceicoccaceae bacterium K14]|nr:hypothetical protein [Puniceicoccaceae bacterium K14]